jgi:hypothetical protein
MIRMIVAFFILYAAFHYGIKAYRQLTNLEKLEISKLVGYSSMCAFLSVSALAAFVFLF